MVLVHFQILLVIVPIPSLIVTALSGGWLGGVILPILEKGRSISFQFGILRGNCMPFLELFINIVRKGTIEFLGKVDRFSCPVALFGLVVAVLRIFLMMEAV